MKKILTKKIIGYGLGIGVGSAIFNYLSYGEIDWKRSVFIAVIASIILAIFYKIKKS